MSMRTMRSAALIVMLCGVCSVADEASKPRVTGKVVDAETGEAIGKFTLVPGTRMLDDDRYKDLPAGFGGALGGDREFQWSHSSAKEGTGGAFDYTFTQSTFTGYHRLMVEADGYEPGVSGPIPGGDKEVSIDFKLAKGRMLAGRVVDADGRAVSGARVVLRRSPIRLHEGKITVFERGGNNAVDTDKNGRFSFQPQQGKVPISVAHPNHGYGETDSQALAASGVIKLQRWGIIDGVLMKGKEPVVGGDVRAFPIRYGGGSPMEMMTQVMENLQATTGKQGRFIIDYVRPGAFSIGRANERRDGVPLFQATHRVIVEPGKTAQITIGGTGRTVIGRAVLPTGAESIGFKYGMNWMSVGQPVMPEIPEEVRAKGPGEIQKWLFSKEAGEQRMALELSRPYAPRISFGLEEDGTFRVEDVPPGTYELALQLTGPRSAGAVRFLATAQSRFTIEEGQSDEPLDLGDIEMAQTGDINTAAGEPPGLRPGQDAPPFVAQTVDGAELKLADFRGKYVLLDFWATWCGPCIAETPNLKAVWESFGQDERFAMIALSLDTTPDLPKKYADENKLGWVQGYLGQDSAVARSYGIHGIPQIMLIGPDGKVVTRDLRGAGIQRAVAKALGEAQ